MKNFVFKLTLLLFSVSCTSLTYADVSEQISADYVARKCSPSHHGHKNGCKQKQVHFITQKKIPLVIKCSGEYVLIENVSFKGNGNAITIAANDVKLRLNNFSIKVKKASGTAIFAENVSEIVIENDAIFNSATTNQTGNGIQLVNVTKALISNVFTRGNFFGLLIQNSSDVQILNSEFLNAVQAGASVSTSTNVVFNNCVFAGSANNGLVFNGANQDCSVLNCEFPNAQFTNLLVQQINGMFVDNCSFTNTGGDPGKGNLVQFGDTNTPDQVANDVIFSNCTIRNRPAPGGNTNPEGLGLYNVSGVLVDSCVIDIDNTGTAQEFDLSGIHIGNGSGVQVGTNVMIRNTIVQGPSMDGFYPDVGSSNIVIDSCLASGALKDGIFVAGTKSCTVQNCTVADNGTNGIFIGEASTLAAIINNVVTNNGFDIITPITDPSIPPTGTGIGISADSSINLVQENQIFGNATNHSDFGFGNVFLDNTEF